jgi:WD40 repeat protein
MVTAEAEPWASARIFICYRREDTGIAAGWLFQRLAKRFGRDLVFMDLENIELGANFVDKIKRAVGSIDVLLPLIGDRWLTIRDDNLRCRIEVPGDYVRLEIEAALQRDVHVIPILVAGATMPEAAALPDSLAELPELNALELSPSRFDADADKLIKELERILAGNWARLWKRSALPVGGSLVLVGALLLTVLIWGGGGSPPSPPLTTGSPTKTTRPISAAMPANAMVVPLKRNRDSKFHLYRVSSTGAAAVSIGKTEPAHAPVLSPDRKTIIYLAGIGNNSTPRIMAADGTGDRDFILRPRSRCKYVEHLAWSRTDPRVLAVVCSGEQGSSTIVLANVDGTIIRKLTSGQDHADDPSFSPDGRRITYWSSAKGASMGALYTVSVAGGRSPRPLTRGTVDADPAWSPVDDVVAFSRSARPDGQGSRAVYLVDTATLSTTKLVSGRDVNSMPVWSPTGNRIVYVKASPAGSDPAKASLWIMDADGGNRHALDASGWALGTPSWGPR